MITQAKIIKYKDKNLLLSLDEEVDRHILQKQVESVEIRFNDGRSISSEQRKKVFAVIRDISLWSGHEPEYLRKYLTWEFMCLHECDWFSLSTVDMTTAKEFITYLIEFCFKWDIPTKDTLLNQTDDISKYLYLCLEHRKCAICNKRAEVHHVDRVGMGFNREKIVHVGLRAIALCHEHHMQAHNNEKELFEEYFVYGINLDEYLCKKLNLKRK